MSKADVAAEQAGEVTAEAEASEQASETAEQAEQASGQITLLVSVTTAAERFIGKVWSVLSVNLSLYAAAKAEQEEDWRIGAQDMIPRGLPILYKVKQAGEVIRVLGLHVPEITQDMADDLRIMAETVRHLPSYLTVLPAYRLLKEAEQAETGKKEAARKKAEQDIRRVWVRLTEGDTEAGTFGTRLPTQEESEKAFAKFGKKAEEAGTSEESSEGSDRNEPTESDSPAHVVEVTLDTAGLEALTADFGGQMAAWEESLKVSREVITAIALGTIRFGAERGYGNLERILSN